MPRSSNGPNDCWSQPCDVEGIRRGWHNPSLPPAETVEPRNGAIAKHGFHLVRYIQQSFGGCGGRGERRRHDGLYPLSLEIATHAVEQRCLLFALANVDHAPEKNSVRCFVDGIGQLAFKADRGVSQNRDTREAVFPFAKRKSILHRSLSAESVRDILLARHQRVDAEVSRTLKRMKR